MTLRAIFLKDDRLRPVLRALVYLVVVLFGVSLMLAALALVPGIGLRQPGAGPSQAGALSIFEICFATTAVAAAVLLRKHLDRRSPQSLGLSFQPSWLRMFSIGSLLGAAMLAFVFVVEEALGYSHITKIGGLASDAASLAISVPLFILVAIAEETSLRGYLFQNVWEEWGMVAAVVITSAAFAAIHLGNPGGRAQVWLTMLGLAGYGALACISVIWTRSLWLAIGMHFAWNLFEGPVLGFPVSGFDLGAPVVVHTVSGPAWFTGGPFGPEAGVSALLALGAGFGGLIWLRRAGVFLGLPDTREAYAMGDEETRSS